MKIERIKQDDGRVRFGDLKYGDAYLKDGRVFIKIDCPTNTSIDLTCGMSWCVGSDTLVTPLPDAVIRY